ncbi:MAG: response regulator [Bacteroidia bacterium]
MKALRVLLADDDIDDCNLFKEVLDGIGSKLPINFTTVSDGVQLMQLLENKKRLPHILFLDLNMPRKNGFDCLEEIQRNEKYKPVAIIIFSTSFNPDIVNMLYQNGAHFYIQKPSRVTDLKKAIQKALALTIERKFIRPSRDKFVVNTPAHSAM